MAVLLRNLASNFPTGGSLKGFEAIAASRMDDPTASSIRKKSSWMTPVVISRQGNAYAFGIGSVQSAGGQSFELMSVYHNGGATWLMSAPVVGPV